MLINKISSIKYNTQNIYSQRNLQKKQDSSCLTNEIYYIPFMARVDKSMGRFYEVNANRMPETVRNYIDNLTDKMSVSPLDATKNAFYGLINAKNIEDVKHLFPNENLFKYLLPVTNTKATNGLLGIYREFKDIYENGILNSGEDLSIYLLKKIFMDAKTIDEINLDLETDLNPDIKSEFKRRYKDSAFILPSTLKAIGIMMPDSAFQTSLRFTREGYSDSFGLKISQGQMRYWNSLSDEQKFEILSKRLDGRDNWWNNLPYEEKLEYAAGIESDEELFKDYKKYVSAQKRKETYGGIGKDGNTLNNIQLTKKKISIGSKLQHKDIFAIWMKKNLENFYNRLSEADKDIVHMKRVRRLAIKWQSMTPEEKTELINKMRDGREPLRFTMIDAWNHSYNIIKELSKYLKEKQILKPIDLLYSSESFSEFQSSIMTEFWSLHPELAAQLGENIKKAQARVEESISRGQFHDLKQEILRDRAYRVKVLEREQYIEFQKLQEQSRKELIEEKTLDYESEFKNLYKIKYYSKTCLPKSYIDEFTDIMFHQYPKEIILKYIDAMKNDTPIPIEVLEHVHKMTYIGDNKMEKIQRALETAISIELNAKNYGNDFFEYQTDTLLLILANKIKHEEYENIKKSGKIDVSRIEKLYNEYKKDLPQDELRSYVLNFFIPKSKNNTDINKLTEYINTYGRSASILFSEQSAFSTKEKIAFKNKFLRLMPEDLKNKYIFLLDTDSKIENEKLIKQIDRELTNRFSFINKNFMKTYLDAVNHVCRYFEESKNEASVVYRPDAFLQFMGNKRQKIKGEVQNIPMPRHSLSQDSKLKFLAIEQSMADALFEVSNDEKVYNLSFEALCDLFEQSEILRKNPKLERKLIINDLFNDIHSDELILKKLPNTRSINQNYYEYINSLQDVLEEAAQENRELNTEDVLFWLNYEAGNDVRDDIVLRRIEGYYI